MIEFNLNTNDGDHGCFHTDTLLLIPTLGLLTKGWQR